MGQKYAGKSASTLVAGTQYTFDSTEIEMEDGIVETTDQGSNGYQEFLSGVRRASLSFEGPYNSGSMALTVGTTYSIKFVVGGSGLSEISFTVPVIIERVRIKTKANSKEPAGIVASGKSNGSFTPSVT